MIYTVTGAAGFIGSRIALKLLEQKKEVIGVDNFLDYYPRHLKEKNLKPLLDFDNFKFLEADLNDIDLNKIIFDGGVVFHQAAQAGVRASWGENFNIYIKCNINATQRLLEFSKTKKITKFVNASSSSVYGDAETLPVKENHIKKPVSPYGVTKLAAENLCYLYFKNYGAPCVSLRYFTVYGPGQRPDMAFHRLFKAALLNGEFGLFGDGEQTRDFTFIDDAVAANLNAAEKGISGAIYNIGGGTNISLKKTIDLIKEITGKNLKINFKPRSKGDVMHTSADCSLAGKEIAFSPRVKIKEGLAAEFDYIKDLYL